MEVVASSGGSRRVGGNARDKSTFSVDNATQEKVHRVTHLYQLPADLPCCLQQRARRPMSRPHGSKSINFLSPCGPQLEVSCFTPRLLLCLPNLFGS